MPRQSSPYAERFMTNVNIPNIISLVRLLLVPVLLYLVLRGEFSTAAVVFIVAGISDAVDGIIARRFHQRTLVGAVLDPAADKLMLLTALTSLTYLGLVPLWLTIAAYAKDSVVFFGVAALKAAGRKVEVRPSVPGKLTTVLQVVTVVYVLALPREAGSTLFTALAALTAFVTALTGVDYAVKEYRAQWGARSLE